MKNLYTTCLFILFSFIFIVNTWCDPISLTAALAGILATGAAISAKIGFTMAAIIGLAASTVVAFGLGLIFKPKTAGFSGASLNAQILLQNTKDTTTPHRIIYGTRRVGGHIFLKTTTENHFFYHTMIAVAGHEVEEFVTAFADDEELVIGPDDFVTNERFVPGGVRSVMKVQFFNGSDDQAAAPDAVAEIPQWTEAHRARGIAYAYIKMEFTIDPFGLKGVPNFTFIVKGRKVFDPRTSTTAFSNNPALCARDYLTADFGINASPDEIDDDQVIAAANTNEEQVQLVDQSFQDRYTCDIILERSDTIQADLDAVASTAVAPITWSQGKFKIFAGVFTPSIANVDDTWLTGDMQITTRVPRSELFNHVKGVFVDETQNFIPTDFPPVGNPFYEEQDGDERLTKEVEFPGTINQERAQRMAKIQLETARQGIIVLIPMNLKGIQLTVWDTISLTFPQVGWDNKLFRVKGWTASQDGLSVSVTVQEESPTSYDWNFGEANNFDPAPDTNLPSAFEILPPGAPNITQQFFVAVPSSSLKIQADITWAASPTAWVLTYQLEYKKTTATNFIVLPRTEDLNFTIFDIEPGVYDFRVKAISAAGISSPYTSTIHEINSLTFPPADITGVSFSALSPNARISWDLHPDLDVRIGGSIIIKFVPEGGNISWENANLVTTEPGNATQTNVPLQDGTYLLKAEDSTGNQSVNFALVTADLVEIIIFNAFLKSIQNPDYVGVKNDMVVADNLLQLDGDELFDDHDPPALFDDALSLFDGGGNFKTFGEYFFDAPLDAGKVITARVNMQLEMLIEDGVQAFDEVEGFLDDHPGLWDGEDLDKLKVKLFIRTTDDDPFGTPTWTPYREFIVGDFTARGFDFKIEVISEFNHLNVKISKLIACVDVPDKTDADTALSSTGADVTVPYNLNFVTPPFVNATIIEEDSGDYFRLLNVTADSFDFSIFANNNQRIAKQINWIAKGF